MTDIVALKSANAKRWANAKLTRNLTSVAKSLVAAKPRYQAVETKTGVPWFVIAVIHEREASGRWDCQLGQGDPLHLISRHVPRGRGPFLDHPGDVPGNDAWHRAAVDALTNCPPYAARWKDWSIGGVLTLLELYNGTGYDDYHHECSPYDWGATTAEEEGKYTGDGQFSADVWDSQVGCAAMLKQMAIDDPTITLLAA